jgi:hypothetical protein
MRGVVAGLLLLGVGCASMKPAETPGLATEAGEIRLEFVEWHEETAELLKWAVPRAATVLTRWGGLKEPVRITVVNSHWELEEMVGRPLPGISAWARRTQVILWDPRWWPLPPRAEQDSKLASQVRRTQVLGLLKHELTHSLMFQRAGKPKWDPRDRIPFWFREGMASVTAKEGAQWPPPESLSQWLTKRPEVDLLKDAQSLARTDPAMAYGAAYHGFDFLVTRYGDETVLRILDLMRERDSFSEAFKDAVGISVESFGTDFRRYLGWRGFVPAGNPARTVSPESLASPRP